MGVLTVRGLDDEIKSRLRIRAALHGRSMESEARAILHNAVAEQPSSGGLGTRIRERFAALGGADLDLPVRNEVPRSAEFES